MAIETTSKQQYESLAAFRYAVRRFLHFSEGAATASGITPQQHQALLAIKGFPERDHVTISELAERLQIRHHSGVGLVDRLVAEKLVVRTPSTLDKRVAMIHLTPKGDKVLRRLSSVHQAQLKEVGPELIKLLTSVLKHEN